MEPDKKQKLVNELCKNGHFEGYREIISVLISTIATEGATVSCRYDTSASNIDPSKERPNHIRVGMVGVKTPLNIIWSLLHEFGHYMDWPMNENDSRIDREHNAWEIAEGYLKDFPELIQEKESYSLFRDWCLNTYYDRHKTPGHQKKVWV